MVLLCLMQAYSLVVAAFKTSDLIQTRAQTALLSVYIKEKR